MQYPLIAIEPETYFSDLHFTNHWNGNNATLRTVPTSASNSGASVSIWWWVSVLLVSCCIFNIFLLSIFLSLLYYFLQLIKTIGRQKLVCSYKMMKHSIQAKDISPSSWPTILFLINSLTSYIRITTTTTITTIK